MGSVTMDETAPGSPGNLPSYGAATGGSLLQRKGVRQFIKFLIVGASSTVIDFAIYLGLIEGLHLQRILGDALGGNKLFGLIDAINLGRIVALCISFSFAVTNGFIWNSKWTFRHTDREGLHQRYVKFVLTNIVGLILNLTILTAVSHLVPPSISGLLAHKLKDPAGFIGKLAATGVVVFWNFLASKYWTFKR
jgi:putative flippase GtrA